MSNLIVTAALAALGAPPAAPAWVYNTTEAGVALAGDDVISYHDGTPVRGLRRHAAEHAGVTYWFASPEHRERFVASPERWLPACGGWDVVMCGVDPTKAGFAPSRWRPTTGTYRIHADRLVLLSDRDEWNTAAAFEQSATKDAILARADSFWADRAARAENIGTLPAGMNPLARLELADWFPLIGRWRCEGWVKTPAGGYRTIGTAEWYFGFGYDGYVIEDRWMPHDNPSGSGPAIRIYDPLAREWGMVFMPSSGPRAAWWQMTGRWEGGELRGEFEAQGGQVHGRLRFYDIGAERFRWISDRSFDAGATWMADYQKTECVRVGDA